jgi:glycosyltransferase involved in cell wall biosynthesis
LLATLLIKNNIKVIVSERTSTFSYHGVFQNKLRSLVIRYLYPRADLVICPSRGVSEDLSNNYDMRKDAIRVINNPVDIKEIAEYSAENTDEPAIGRNTNIIMAMGRLGNEKGFDHLIKAAAILKKTPMDFRLVIVGEGRERKNLEDLISEFRIGDTVELAGFQRNPYTFLSRSTIFVLSSLFEGFPNVLLEALSLGIPCVATRCPTGPEEILHDGVNGLLVPPGDEQALAEAISRLLHDDELRKRFSENGRMRAEDFAVEKIVRQFENEITRVAGCGT